MSAYEKALIEEDKDSPVVEYLLDRGRVMLAKMEALEREIDVLHAARAQLLELR